MHLFGFASVAEFQATTGVVIPVGADIHLLARWDHRVTAVYRHDGAWHLDRWWKSDRTTDNEGKIQFLSVPFASNLMREALDDRRARSGIVRDKTRPRLPDGLGVALERVAGVILADQGAQALYGATYTTGEWDDTHTTIVALYPQPEMAIAHARAAAIHEADADAEEHWDGSGTWGVCLEIARHALPAHLQAILDEGRQPRARPCLSMDDTMVWHVDVPDRGRISFRGQDCTRVAARFFSGLPLAKVTTLIQVESEDLAAMQEVTLEGGELRW